MKNNKLSRKGLNKNLNNYLFVALFLFLPVGSWAFFFFTTNISSIIMAFQHIDLDGNKTWAGLNNFKEFIQNCISDGDILAISAINSLKNYLICLLICMPFYIFFSYYIFKKTFASKFVQSVSMIPRIIPGMVISLVFMSFVEESIPDIAVKIFHTKIPNFFTDPKYTYGTTLFYTIWLSFSTSLIVYPNAMNGIDKEIFESAELDGVDNVFTELWYIILPLIYPTLETFLITGFAGFLTESGPLVTFWYTYAPKETQNIAYYYYKETFFVSNETGYPLLSAGGLIMTAIIAPLTHLLKRILDKYAPYEG